METPADEPGNTIPVSPPAPPVSDLPQRKSRLPLVLIIVVLFLLVGTGSYFLGRQTNTASQTPKISLQPSVQAQVTPAQPTAAPIADPTADWQTYTDPKYHFSFKYPSDWKFSFTNDQNNQAQFIDNHFVAFGIPATDTSKPDLSVGVEVHTNNHNLGLPGWLQLASSGQDSANTDKQQTAVNGQVAYKTIIQPDTEDVLVLSPNNRLYRIILYGNGGEGVVGTLYDKNDPFLTQAVTEFDRMLATFTFPKTP